MASDNKYDRQLRLWGANGQKALSNASILCLGTSSSGIETLKNLVLPGIGSFTIVDDGLINGREEETVGGGSGQPEGNFFLTRENVGESTASNATKNLLELNPDTRGSFIHTLDSSKSLLSWIQSDLASNIVASPPTLVISNDLPFEHAKEVEKIIGDTPHIVLRSYGLIGVVRCVVTKHRTVESKPDSERSDIRIEGGWDSSGAEDSSLESDLVQLSGKLFGEDWEKLDGQEHGHIPWIFILLRAKGIYKARYAGKGRPKSMEEKGNFSNIIKEMARDINMELNFSEALSNAYYAYSSRDFPFEVQELISGVESASSSSSSWERCLVGMKCFMDRSGGAAPLNGSIPDMTSSSSSFIALQTLYLKHSKRDQDAVKLLIPGDVSDDYLEVFCKNVYNLREVTTRKFGEEGKEGGGEGAGEKWEEIKEELQMQIMMLDQSDPAAQSDPANSPLLWYFTLLGCETFYSLHSQYPGFDSRSLAQKADATELRQLILQIASTYGIDTPLLSGGEHADEATRWFAADVHNIGSVVGGVAGQEAVKIITGQYELGAGCGGSTFVFNGINGEAGIYNF